MASKEKAVSLKNQSILNLLEIGLMSKQNVDFHSIFEAKNVPLIELFLTPLYVYHF